MAPARSRDERGPAVVAGDSPTYNTTSPRYARSASTAIVDTSSRTSPGASSRGGQHRSSDAEGCAAAASAPPVRTDAKGGGLVPSADDAWCPFVSAPSHG